MSVIAVALKHMFAAGMSQEDIIAAVEEMEAELPHAMPADSRSKAAIRQARYREGKRNENVTNHNKTSQSVTNVTPVTESVTKRNENVTRDASESETKTPPTPPIKTHSLPLKENPPYGGQKKAPPRGKMTIEIWEKHNGELKPEDFVEMAFATQHGMTKQELGMLLEKFRSNCLANGRLYVDFRQAFRSWDWVKDIENIRKNNHASIISSSGQHRGQSSRGYGGSRRKTQAELIDEQTERIIAEREARYASDPGFEG